MALTEDRRNQIAWLADSLDAIIRQESYSWCRPLDHGKIDETVQRAVKSVLNAKEQMTECEKKCAILAKAFSDANIQGAPSQEEWREFINALAESAGELKQKLKEE